MHLRITQKTAKNLFSLDLDAQNYVLRLFLDKDLMFPLYFRYISGTEQICRGKKGTGGVHAARSDKSEEIHCKQT